MHYNVGELIQLTKSIYDDGEDHHEPGWLAYMGDILIIRKVYKNYLGISHLGVKGVYFTVDYSEVKRILNVKTGDK